MIEWDCGFLTPLQKRFYMKLRQRRKHVEQIMRGAARFPYRAAIATLPSGRPSLRQMTREYCKRGGTNKRRVANAAREAWCALIGRAFCQFSSSFVGVVYSYPTSALGKTEEDFSSSGQSIPSNDSGDASIHGDPLPLGRLPSPPW